MQGVGLGVNKDAGGKPIIDESKEKTNIRIKFHNGETEVLTVNHDHKVSDVYTYVHVAAPVQGEFVLTMAGFPPKPLENMGMTIKEAGLVNAAITQKIK